MLTFGSLFAGIGGFDLGFERRAECAERHGNNGFGLTLEQFMAIEESGRSLMPTLTARDHRSGKASEATHARNARPLNEVVQRLTPTLNAASGDKGPRKVATKAENGGHQVNLIDLTAHLQARGGGVLNPRWCEWYMGFPDGWCDLPSADSGTASCPKSPSGLADTSPPTPEAEPWE